MKISQNGDRQGFSRPRIFGCSLEWHISEDHPLRILQLQNEVLWIGHWDSLA